MKRPHPILMRTMFAASLALNLAFLAYHARVGTFRRLLVKADLAEAPVDRSAHQAAMEARYRKLPVTPAGVVFAGDSLIYHGPWAEFYSEIHNRGIANETSALLLGRLDEITRARPRTLILLTGANDLTQGVPVAQLVRNCRAILDRVRSESPGTAVALVGLLPVDRSLPDGPRFDNPTVLEANRALEALARGFPGTRFLDLTSRLADGSGKLRRELTEDGLHLNLDGYLAVRDAVRALIDEPAGSDHPTPDRSARDQK